ncbi:hypothetical protein [Streptomyces prunicolor]|uniref:hypothetical protein n=1 Tax=Streptomyces prunicolor TaxID=67348 RepID=UPI0033DDF9FB
MTAIKPDTRSRESMAASKGGEWRTKADSVKGRNARKRTAVTEAPKREARPYPPAPISTRLGSRIAVAELRGHSDPGIPHLPRRAIGPKLAVDRPMTKREQSNNLPFVPEFQAEGQPFPRVARDKDGNVMPRVRTDNGMTDQLKGRGIGRDGKTGLEAYPKRQREAIEAESKARLETALEVSRLHHITREVDNARTDAKRALLDAIGREREALARGDMAAAESAREDVRRFRKASRFKG